MITVDVSGIGTVGLNLHDGDQSITDSDGKRRRGDFTGDAYTVEGIFSDLNLAAAVRERWAWRPTPCSRPATLARLTSLTANSNLITSLQGLENATILTSLTLVPGDFSQKPTAALDLSPLSGLPLTTLTLEDCGLVSPTFPTLSSLTTLDLRYNGIVTLPAVPSTVNQLMVYGNPLSTNDGYHGLLSIKGDLINIDLAPDQPETARLSPSTPNWPLDCYYLPIEMYEYVVNTIEYQPYEGAMKGPLATLQTRPATIGIRPACSPDCWARPGFRPGTLMGVSPCLMEWRRTISGPWMPPGMPRAQQ